MWILGLEGFLMPFLQFGLKRKNGWLPTVEAIHFVGKLQIGMKVEVICHTFSLGANDQPWFTIIQWCVRCIITQSVFLFCRIKNSFMHLKIVCQNNKYILGQFSKPFDTVPEMIHYYSINKLNIKGAEHKQLLHPVIQQPEYFTLEPPVYSTAMWNWMITHQGPWCRIQPAVSKLTLSFLGQVMERLFTIATLNSVNGILWCYPGFSRKCR